ncbi:HNH endonuclease [Myxococcus sp. AM011]|uniref:HNH endonuclease n=1 Tax=Myxococcus sp. AM011 TaxID=2745200 RepID=UPI0015953D2C|nr:HNH endonuclease signature motif containing protein [Myxococcus sp. AM011]NVJ22130.1 HNH endonuclease [Myxococcus sp. AM011]
MVLSYGEERGYAGNEGYADELESVYRYDSKVQNHLQIAKGDLLIICDKRQVLGVANVAKIDTAEATKRQKKCPTCGATVRTERKTLRPRFKCEEGHFVDDVLSIEIPCIEYSAWFDGTFREIPEGALISIEQVRAACINFNKQMAMQQVALSGLKEFAPALLPLIQQLASPGPIHGLTLAAADALEEPYVPNLEDERARVSREIRARRGQKVFRQSLRDRFGDKCLVTKCQLIDLLEAAHIVPYRGDNDNHVMNGLLLRADVHTLFDLDLLGIEPETLKIHLHDKVKGKGYDTWDGALLDCDAKLLSRDALETRWIKFQRAQKRARVANELSPSRP